MTNQISTVAKQYFYWFFIQRTVRNYLSYANLEIINRCLE